MVLDGPVVSRENGATNAQSHARASVADEVPDIPTVFVRAGRFSCPWCEFETAHSSGLMTHITRMHAFELLSDESANYMLGLGRAVCRDCGFLRVRQGRQCGRCSSVRAPRPVRPGDAVQPVDFEMINSDSEADVSDPVETPGPSAMGAEPPEPADAGVGARGQLDPSRAQTRARAAASWSGSSDSAAAGTRATHPREPYGDNAQHLGLKYASHPGEPA